MEDKKPTFLDKVKSVLKETAKYAADGMKNVPPEEYIRRTSICNKCPKFVHENHSCGVCGCYMHVKARWSTSECPDKKWSKWDWEKESKE